jgi:UPF0755 protein
MIEVFKLINSGAVIQHKLTIPEGLSNFQTIALINQAYGLEGEIDAKQYNEGWLMPDTYRYTYPTQKESLLKQMHQITQKFLEDKINQPLPDILENKEAVIILASIVEKETSMPQERPVVAAVYLNRLRKNMPLQADPTVIYGLTNGKYDLGRPLSHADLLTPSLFNTYLHPGLPPQAIANPGRGSIEAVLAPAVHNFIYFVADGKGGHNFANSYAEHLLNVSQYRKATAKEVK